MVYTMMVLITIMIIAGIVLGIVFDIVVLTLMAGGFALFWAVVLVVMFCCCADTLNAAIVLLKVTGIFIREKPTVLLAPFFVIFAGFFYFVFWIGTFVAIQLDRPWEQYQQSF